MLNNNKKDNQKKKITTRNKISNNKQWREQNVPGISTNSRNQMKSLEKFVSSVLAEQTYERTNTHIVVKQFQQIPLRELLYGGVATGMKKICIFTGLSEIIETSRKKIGHFSCLSPLAYLNGYYIVFFFFLKK